MLRVFRSQFNSLAADIKPLHRGLIFQQRDHDVAVFSHGLLAHHHQVALPDSGVHHAVPGHFQSEAPACPSDPAFDQHLSDDVFLGQDRLAGRHSADDGDGHKIGDVVHGFTDNRNATSLPGFALQIAFADKLVHLTVDAGMRYSEDVREFLHGRGEPPPVREEADLLQCTALRLCYFLNGASASRFLTHVYPQPSKWLICERQWPQGPVRANYDHITG